MRKNQKQQPSYQTNLTRNVRYENAWFDKHNNINALKTHQSDSNDNYTSANNSSQKPPRINNNTPINFTDNIPAYLSEIPPTESEHPPECQPEFLDFDPFFNEEIANRQDEYNEGLDDNVGCWYGYDGNFEGLAETREIADNALNSAAGRIRPLPTANINQPNTQGG